MYRAKTTGTKDRAMVVAEPESGWAEAGAIVVAGSRTNERPDHVKPESGWTEAGAIGVAGSRSSERANRVESSERVRWWNGAGSGGDEQLLRLLPEVVYTAKAVVKKKAASVAKSPVAW